MKKPVFFLPAAILLIAASLTITTGCKKKDTSFRRASIEAGREIKLTRETIPASGGEIVIDEPGNPLDGMTIEVPGDAYADDQRFTVSYADIINYDCGPYFNPLTPLIRISNDGEIAEQPIKISIPVRIPKGHFAMAFFYNEETGRLDPLQPDYSEEEETNDHVNAYTLSFSNTGGERSYDGLHSNTGLVTGAGVTKDINQLSIIISSVNEKELRGRHITPFKPGVDDWQFPNWGSAIAPNGHCAGQSMAMLWYYSEKKLNGSPALFGRFDNDGGEKTTAIWEDDVLGYRFCGVLQNDWTYSWGNEVLELWQGTNDQRTRKAFAYALKQTDEPQLVHIWPKDKTATHAMVVYGIDKGNLFIADPNFPGIDERTIWFDEHNKNYSPYYSGDNVSVLGKQYTKIHYLAKTTIRSWYTATQHWKEVANKTIGKDEYPAYTITALNENEEFVSVTDEFVVTHPEKLLTLNIRSDGWKSKYKIFGPFTRDGNTISPLASTSSRLLLGICVMDKDDKWVGFKWIRLKYKKKKDQGNEKGDEGPTYSDELRVNMEVDGKNVQMAQGIFGILGQFFSLKGKTDNTIDGSVVSIETEDWDGPGEYTITKGEWKDNTVTGGIFTTKDKTGTLFVTNWSKGRLEGSFIFTVTEDYVTRPVTKTITGNFSFRE